MEAASSPAFQYFVSEKNAVVIVTMIGTLNASAIAELEKCATAVVTTQARVVILHFREVGPKVERPVLRSITALQKQVRAMPARLLLAGVHPELKQFLTEQGVLRPDEVVNNLKDALQALLLAKPA